MTDKNTTSTLKTVICSKRGGHEHTSEYSIRLIYDALDPASKLEVDEEVAYLEAHGHLPSPSDVSDASEAPEVDERPSTPTDDEGGE